MLPLFHFFRFDSLLDVARVGHRREKIRVAAAAYLFVIVIVKLLDIQ